MERRRGGARGEEQDSHYRPGLRCLLLAPASSAGAASRFGAEGGERNSEEAWPQDLDPRSGQNTLRSLSPSHPEGEEGPQHPRPPSLCARIAGPAAARWR